MENPIDKLNAKLRRKEILKKYQHYVDTYNFTDVDDVTFIKDMIYGIGIAINPDEYTWADGFEKWLKVLRYILCKEEKKNDNTSGNSLQ